MRYLIIDKRPKIGEKEISTASERIIEELKKKIEFMLQTMDQKGLEQAYKILQRIWIRHGTQQ